jgi:hypothetical protein
MTEGKCGAGFMSGYILLTIYAMQRLWKASLRHANYLGTGEINRAHFSRK